jgi:hypothetical protein
MDSKPAPAPTVVEMSKEYPVGIITVVMKPCLSFQSGSDKIGVLRTFESEQDYRCAKVGRATASRDQELWARLKM